MTLAYGVADFPVMWEVLKEDCSSPHSPILVIVGHKSQFPSYESIDWDSFDWDVYSSRSKTHFGSLLSKWKSSNIEPERAIEQLVEEINGLVNEVAISKVVSSHSKPWVSKDIAAMLNQLRAAKARYRRHRSPSNLSLLNHLRQQVSDSLVAAKEEWILNQCKSLPDLPEKQKWNVINRLSNFSPSGGIQPLKKHLPDGSSEFVFDDSGIREMMEEYHISKDISDSDLLVRNAKIKSMVARVKLDMSKSSDSSIMSSPITAGEVDLTFNSSKGAAGPDHIMSTLLDNADRDSTSLCMLYIFNLLWNQGKFPDQWKRELRSVLPKLDKEDHHNCNSYRTISLTSIIGKRFEKISGRRLIALMEEKGFDIDQYAYLAGRSATQALTFMIEKLSVGVAEKKHCGVLFFDFADAFGSVDRAKLLEKLFVDFDIHGNLFLHLASFLSNRKACLKLGNGLGEWLPSHSGTSAGTILGPILFILSVHDTPKSVKPKFADDVNGIAIEDTASLLQATLQSYANEMSSWSLKNGMPINTSKTVVMQFGSHNDVININFNGTPIKEVAERSCLGVWLDSRLSFRKHTQVACAKAMKCLSKVMCLVKGRSGLSLPIAIQCFKALIRCHPEYAVPSWWFRGHKFIKEFKSVQHQCLRLLTSTFKNSSCNALEVITSIQPVQLRIKDLVIREYARILSLPSHHPLAISMSAFEDFRGQPFSPLSYLAKVGRKFSKELHLKGLFISTRSPLLPSHIQSQRVFPFLDIISGDIGKSGARSDDNKLQAQLDMERFTESHLSESCSLIFCDGSVSAQGNSGCAAVLVTPNRISVSSRHISCSHDNVEAEVDGIVLALESALAYVTGVEAQVQSKVIIISDCESALEIVRFQKDVGNWLPYFEKIWTAESSLRSLGVRVAFAWIPSHCGIHFNELADQEAKDASKRLIPEHVGPVAISLDQAKKLIAEGIFKEWQSLWSISQSGSATREIIPSVKSKVVFSDTRSAGVTHVRCLLNNAAVADNLFRMHLADSPNCPNCPGHRETVEHALIHCGSRHAIKHELGVSLPPGVSLDLAGVLGPAPSNLSKGLKDSFHESVHGFLAHFRL